MPMTKSFIYLDLSEFLKDEEIASITNYETFRKDINSGHIFQKYEFLMKIIELSISKFTEFKEQIFAGLLRWVLKILKENLEIKEVVKNVINTEVNSNEEKTKEEKEMEDGYLKEYSFGTKENFVSYLLKKGLGKFVIKVGNKKYLDWKSLWKMKDQKKKKEINSFTPSLLSASLLSKLEEPHVNFLDRNYNIFSLLKRVGRPNILPTTCTAIFNSLGFFTLINYPKFKNFIEKVALGYKDNPYHTDIHASDMVQTLYLYFSEANVFSRLELMTLDRVSIFLAAAVHDLGHPGVNNGYLVRTGDDIAITYNDQSVLENYHIASAFRIILREKDCNIFENFIEDDYTTCRKKMISFVLSTDMCLHSKLTMFLKLKLQSYGIQKHQKSGLMFEGISEDVSYSLKQDFLCVLIHSADISNPTKPWDIYKEWASRCVNEFFLQGDKERKRGLEISFNCDRNTVSLPKSQIGFIDYVVGPYFDSIVEYFPVLSFLTENIRSNKERFNVIIKEAEERKKRKESKVLCSC